MRAGTPLSASPRVRPLQRSWPCSAARRAGPIVWTSEIYMDTKVIYSMVGVGKTYPPSKQVLRDISLSYFYGAKIGVIGLNGAGKSTLLRIMAGVEKAFNGDTILAPGYTIGYLEQQPVLDAAKTVRAIVEEGVLEVVEALRELEDMNAQYATADLSADAMEA